MSAIALRPAPSQILRAQTLASFGRKSDCQDLAVDRAGNIYLSVRPCPDQPQFLLIMLEANINRAVQLAVITADEQSRNVPKAITITPDGQHLLIAQRDKTVFKYSPPSQHGPPEWLGEADQKVWCMVADDQT
jgi:hypothetical protein